jgi:UDP-N-acetylglucosamine 2-epimerase (non-hydrolysing)
MKKILVVAGARPNFMKIAPLLRALKNQYRRVIKPVLVHTGQHYDKNMSGDFFTGLGIQAPDYSLAAGSSTPARQTARIMTGFEDVCAKEKPVCVVVVGDVNSTIAAALVAKKMGLTLAHVEAGLRSGNLSMPEEINRRATDAIADIFFTTEKQGALNLLKEGHAKKDIYFAGQVMIDNLYFQFHKLDKAGPRRDAKELKDRLCAKYLCLTLHRPSNVDKKEDLERCAVALRKIAEDLPIIFPCHPRTQKMIRKYGLRNFFKTPHEISGKIRSGVIMVAPMSYNDFLFMWKDAAAVLTDSGGLQEETTALRVPCLTLRADTERPVTITEGSNILVGKDMRKLASCVREILAGHVKKCRVPDLWDGHASERIARVLCKRLK